MARRELAKCGVIVCLAATVAAPALAQAPQPAERPSNHDLHVAEIMAGPAFVGTSPSRLRWSPDGRALYFVWKQPGADSDGLYRVDRDGGNLARLADEEAREIERRFAAVYSEDRRRAAYAQRGELYLLDVRADRERALASFSDPLSDVQIAADGGTVYFVSRDNFFQVDVESGAVKQLTDIRSGEDPEEEELEGQRKFLEEEQEELFRVFREDSLRRARSWPPPREKAAVDTPKPLFLADGDNIEGFWVAPSGASMAFVVESVAEEARLAWVPDYVTKDGYTRQAPRKRTNVGDEQSTGKMGVMDLASGEIVWVDHGQGDRRVELMFRGWSDDSRRLLSVAISADYHDRWVLLTDAADGESRALDHLHDDAWVGGPVSWNSAGWMPDGDRVWFVSEATGFAHLFSVAAGGGEPTALTSGPWEVLSVEIAPNKKEWYLVTSESSPHERGFYRMNLSGSDRRLVSDFGTLQGGAGRSVDATAVAPDGRRLAALYAWPNHPPELFLQENGPAARPRQVTESTTQEFRSREWLVPEIVYIRTRDGVEVPARLYRPGQPNGAAVIFVHGAGYLQNVHRWWSVYFREYMFHNLLVERGYTVLDIDYRGSAGYGRDWRTAIRKHMGGKDLTDQVDGAHYLIESMGIAAERLGIYGGSYGGFTTLMAMFTQPGTFAAGAALRPVTDWAYYNHWYTSRILGLPPGDSEAYQLSSPIYFADGLEGALLIAHGMIDQNVHFQDTVRLTQRLIELGKENWEVAIYPKEDHGFVHAWSWTDEYSRILKLFDENLGQSE